MVSTKQPTTGKSVVKEPRSLRQLGDSVVLSIASVADEIPQWGITPALRDRKLRDFWPTEPVLSSAVYSTTGRYAAFGWALEGPPRTSSIVQHLLHGVEHGKGWLHFILKVLIDLFTQDNGAFIEVIRAENSPTSPVLSLSHLDAGRCMRTGRWDQPVIYQDIDGIYHELQWYQVITLEEFPSPIEQARGMQYCAVTRLLRAAQIMRDISIYKREKISGRFTRAIHLVSGVQKRTLEDALAQQSENADNRGLIRYIQPLIVASLDPNATISHEVIEMATLPDGFDEEINMRWYINQLALAFGTDYQDFAPLPGGNLGTAQQSQVLHLKSRGKGPALFMSMLEQLFNWHGIMPNTVRFRFGEQDTAGDLERVMVAKARAEVRKIQIESGEITPQVARQMALDSGDIREEYLQLMGEQNATADTVVSGSDNIA